MYRFLRLTAVSLLCHLALLAQTATGVLQGVVTDPSGAPVPEAKVTVENQRTSVRINTVTNAEGRYVSPFLSPSEYRLTVEKSGFQKNVTNDIKVDVQQTVGLDIQLKIGDVSSVVEVQASSVQLSTEPSSVATVIDNKRILDMPLNGRNPFSLAQLSPGVIRGGGATPWISGG